MSETREPGLDPSEGPLRVQPAGRDAMIQIPAGRHKVWLATLWAFLIMGAGQLYNRQYVKGAFFLVLGVTTMSVGHGALIVWAITAFGSLIDARVIARKLHAGTPVGKWEFF